MDSLKSVLVHLDASSRCGQRLSAAASLARQHQAQVLALYAVIPPSLQYVYANGVSADILERLRPLEDERRAAARKEFDQAVAAGLENASWLEPGRGGVSRDFSRQAFYADLLVLGQREPDDKGESGVRADFVETVLMDSGKPALVVPYIGAPADMGKVIMISWKESRETARAIAAAMPLLKKADRVHIASWGDEQSAERRRIDTLVAHFQRHGVAPVVHHYGRESGDVGAYMLSAAADLAADLVVMGAYGHSRAREWVLGGATRTLLASMTVPVLMSH